MSNAKTTRVTIELTADLANAVAKAAGANKITVEEAIGECISQQLEHALRHRVLIQRQNDVDEALLELASWSAPERRPNRAQETICRYRSADAE